MAERRNFKNESIREKLRGLMQYLKGKTKLKEIDITDAVIFERERGGERIEPDTALDDYYERASRYVKENENNPVLWKLKNNTPLDNDDFAALEEIFWHEVGSQDEYKKMLPEKTQDMTPGVLRDCRKKRLKRLSRLSLTKTPTMKSKSDL